MSGWPKTIKRVKPVDSTKGYTRANVVITRWIVNSMKNAFTVTQFLEECRAVVDYNKRNHEPH